jgi:thiamine biosynthesis lipoprotein
LITAAVNKDLNRVHGFWHPWEPGPLGRINSLLPTGGWFTLPPSTLPLFDGSYALSAQSHFLFNPAIGGLIRLWGFDDAIRPNQKPPPAEEIKALVKANPRLGDVEIKGLRMRSNNPAVLLDFGAFAKGLAVDLAIARLRELGVQHALVNAGGDLRAIGRHGQRPWKIGIKHPRANGVLAFIETQADESIFTSGDYERYFMHNKIRYHHIIDPRNGYPAQESMSVTVVHAQASVADAAATALFIAGPSQWRSIAKDMGVTMVMLIGRDNKIYLSDALHKRITFSANNPYEIIIGGP